MPSPLSQLSRVARTVLLAAALAVTAVLLLVAGNQILALQARLEAYPAWAPWLWWVVALALLGLVGAVGWRLLFPRRRRGSGTAAVPDEAGLRRRIEEWEAEGVDLSAARAELAELERRRAAGSVVVAVYGEISSGKSSVIRALLPEAEVAVDVLGGTTDAVRRYRWEAPSGDTLVLADMPGFDSPEGGDEDGTREEAQRAHLVLFVAEGDLTRDQWRRLESVRALGKPMVVALNKSDRYTGAEQQAIRERLAGRLGGDVPVVTVVAGGQETVVRRQADGGAVETEQERPADVRGLRRALQATLDRYGDRIEPLRDQAIFLLTARKVEGAVAAHRRDAADALVRRYARRAVVGALAAITPGSDLVIQSALAAGLVRELCSLYRVPVREVDLERVVSGLGRRARTVTPVVLGVAGNALKAFPGVGTIAGGLAHAVAYGLLFTVAGRALVGSLEQQGELDAGDVLERFEEAAGEDLESPARELARVALEEDGTDEAARYRR